MERITLDDYFDMMCYLRELGFRDYVLIGCNDTLRLILDERFLHDFTISALIQKFRFNIRPVYFDERLSFEIKLVNER